MGITHFDCVTTGRRAVLLGIGALALAPAATRAEPKAAPRVLFVCQYGSVKSPIAREILRRRARERGIAVSTISRGITPEAHLPPEIAARLLADGIDPARDGLHRLTPGDLQTGDIVVAFNPLPPGLPVAHGEDWTSVPSVLEAYPAAVADIKRRVELLLDRIAG